MKFLLESISKLCNLILLTSNKILCNYYAKIVDYQIIVEILTGIVEGKFPKRALNLVMEWYELNKDALLNNWNSLMLNGEYEKINPLE